MAGQRLVEPSGQVVEVVDLGGSRQDARGDAAQRPEPAGEQLGPDGGGEDVLGGVRLVEDRQVVLGEDRPAGRHVDAVEVQVGDDDLRPGGTVAGLLGEAPLAAGAAQPARALVGADADRRPGRGAGLEGQFGPVAGVGVRRPVGDGGQLLVVGLLGQSVEGLLHVGLGDLGQPLEAHVVGASLQDGPGDRFVEVLAEVFGEEGQVAAGQLVLEGLGGGGDDGSPAGEERRHEVGEGLAGSGPGLDAEEAVGVDHLGHRPGHGLLAGAPLAAAGELPGDLL